MRLEGQGLLWRRLSYQTASPPPWAPPLFICLTRLHAVAQFLRQSWAVCRGNRVHRGPGPKTSVVQHHRVLCGGFVRQESASQSTLCLCLLCFSYAIMKMCWHLEPTERPTFSKISQMIERLLGDQPEQEQVSQGEFGLASTKSSKRNRAGDAAAKMSSGNPAVQNLILPQKKGDSFSHVKLINWIFCD